MIHSPRGKFYIYIREAPISHLYWRYLQWFKNIDDNAKDKTVLSERISSFDINGRLYQHCMLDAINGL